jgi:hypothetical protein
LDNAVESRDRRQHQLDDARAAMPKPDWKPDLVALVPDWNLVPKPNSASVSSGH